MTRRRGDISGKDKRRRRNAVIKRDGSSCHWCGLPDALTLDHVIPVSAGGSSRIENLVMACEPCNQARGGIHGAASRPHLVGKPSATGIRYPHDRSETVHG